MRTPLAWSNLRQEPTRTAIALGGVTFAAVLMLMQLGFFQSARLTAVLIYERLDFDLLLLSPDYQHLAFPGTLPARRLVQARAVPGVASAVGLGIGSELWNRPAPDGGPVREPAPDRRRRNIMIFACDPNDRAFLIEEITNNVRLLKQDGAALFDRRSRPDFGTPGVGTETEVGRTRIRVVGGYELGTGFGADGAMTVDWNTFRKITHQPADLVQLGLVKLAPGADPETVAAALRRSFPEEDVLVRTRAEVEDRERTYWVEKTSVGVIFACGTIVAFLVGISIVYQVLANDIAYRIGEYATLKAIGYSQGYLSSVVLQQATILALLGYLPGWLLAWLGYRLTQAAARIPMELGWELSLGVLGLTFLMCCTSGILALRKLAAADPADLF